MTFPPFCPVKLAARYKKCFPSGKNTGQRRPLCPRVLSMTLIWVGVPPEASTRDRPEVTSGAKTITPSLFQVPPRPEGASQIVCTGPPDTSSFFNCASAKNARDRPSADQKG